MITKFKILESLKSSRNKYKNEIDDKIGFGTFEVLAAIDPSKSYKYLDIICKYALDGVDLDEIKKYILLFDKLSKKNKLINKDIFNYTNFNDLKNIENIDSTTKSDINNEIKRQVKIFINNKDLLLLSPETHRSSIKYGFGTKWCISMKDDKFFYYALLKQGYKFLFLIIKNKELSYKLFNKFKNDINTGRSIGSSQGDPYDEKNFEKVAILVPPENGRIQIYTKSNHDVNCDVNEFLKELNIDKKIFRNDNKKVDIYDILEKNIMITKFNIFENSGKFITVDYKIIVKDLKDNPTMLVTDFNIVKLESKKSIIKAKGYIKENLTDYNNKKKKVWVEFDDFKEDNTRVVWNKNFENGTKKIKVIS